VAAPPYDVVSYEEAKAAAKGRPHSFLHVSRAEIDLHEGTDPYSPPVYAQAAKALQTLLNQGVLIKDEKPCYYVYQMSRDAHVQTGVAAAASVPAYLENRVRKHELTRPSKEEDRVRQIEAVDAHTGPVMTAHAPNTTISGIVAQIADGDPISDAVTDDGTRHRVWSTSDPDTLDGLTSAFEGLGAIYIADGHHRSAAAARVAEARAAQSDGRLTIDDSRFLVISFPSDSVTILDYNRIVSDLNKLGTNDFLKAVEQNFHMEKVPDLYHPTEKRTFGMVIDGAWYRLSPLAPPPSDYPAVRRLDVAILSDLLLAPILNITDPRSDPRIDFVGGSRGLQALHDPVVTGKAAVAFSLFPTALEDVMSVADAGDIMPPKSTWFEPKLADGLLSLPVTG
jgi:uncharacterized protein (DUF1015 family)